MLCGIYGGKSKIKGTLKFIMLINVINKCSFRKQQEKLRKRENMFSIQQKVIIYILHGY